MYLSSSDGTANMNVDGLSQIRQENTSSYTANPDTSPASPSSSFPALLVVDDNSNSDDSSFNQSHIPVKTPSLTPETTHAQGTPVATTPPTNDNSNDTPDQQRRRNSSIAKLLGGQPLNNQQYEDIHQRIIDDQTAQTMNTNGDNSTDSPIPRSRSSITRTLLMNAERNMNGTHVPVVSTRPISPSFPQDFEYLIRRELDIEHAPSTLYRNSSSPSVFQNLSSARNTPPASSPTPSQSKLKRKRANPKQVLLPGAARGKAPSAAAPFAMRDPFELGSSSSPSIPSVSSTTLSHPQQNHLYRFDCVYNRPRLQAQFLSALSNGPSDSPLPPPPPPPPPFNYHRPTHALSNYGQMKSHLDRVPPPSSCSSVNPYPYSGPLDLALPHTSSHSHLSSASQHTSGVSPRKSKLSNTRPDPHESPIQRLQSTSSNPSSVSSSSSSSSSSGQSVPLKKRLLHAYKNERWPSSSL